MEGSPERSEKRIGLAASAGRLLAEHNLLIQRVIVYGSTAREMARHDSDIDLCVTTEQPLPDVQVYDEFIPSLEKILEDNGYKVGNGPGEICLDYVDEESLANPGRFNRPSMPDLAENVAREGYTLYNRKFAKQAA